MFGIFGALGRHYFGKFLNGIRGFPVGTFCANISGSLIYTILYVVKGWLNDKADLSDSGAHDFALAIFFISAIETGFCSSLTTISSFVNDIYSLQVPKRYIYSIATILIAQIISITVTFIVYSSRGA